MIKKISMSRSGEDQAMFIENYSKWFLKTTLYKESQKTYWSYH